jgi:hypothetical protein
LVPTRPSAPTPIQTPVTGPLREKVSRCHERIRPRRVAVKTPPAYPEVPLGPGTSYVSSRKALRLAVELTELEAGGDGETDGGDAGGDVLDEKCDTCDA